VKGGKWIISGKRRVLYVRRELGDSEAVAACRRKISGGDRQEEDVI
jgi:hypothetical protein